MSTYVAKYVSLDVMRECRGNNCSCFTDKGYYIRYQNGNVDSMLFVCEDCYNTYYKSKCTIGSFDEEEYQHSVRKQRYYEGDPSLRRFLREFRKGIRFTRIACALLSVLLISAFCLKEQPQFRSEYPPHEINLEVNSNVHGFENITVQFQSILDRITKVITHDGGNKDD